MLNTIDIHWDLLGAKLAALSADEQGEFFVGFARELDGYDTHYSREMQMAYVADKLTDRAKKTLGSYLPMLWYKDAAES